MPNKVKNFAWLYFKDRPSTKSNLFHKHVLDNLVCQRCSHSIEDRCHVFFNCPLSKEVWRSIGMPTLSEVEDTDVWSLQPPFGQDHRIWPSILQVLLWRLWDARNRIVFINEQLSSRYVVSRVCDDLSVWEGRFVSASLVLGLRRWRLYLHSCVSTQGSASS